MGSPNKGDVMAGPDDGAVQAGFANAILDPASALTTAIEYIGENLEPGDVFPDDKLLAWAKLRGFQPLPKDEE